MSIIKKDLAINIKFITDNPPKVVVAKSKIISW